MRCSGINYLFDLTPISFPNNMPMETSIIVALLSLFGTLVIGILNFGKMSKADAIRLEHRLTSLESKLEPIWQAIIKEIPKLLISPHTPEFDDLVEKAMDNLEGMTITEVKRLMTLLDQEYDVAVKEKNTGRAVGISLMKAGVKSTTVDLNIVI